MLGTVEYSFVKKKKFQKENVAKKCLKEEKNVHILQLEKSFPCKLSVILKMIYFYLVHYNF